MVGRENPSSIYLIDLGLAVPFRDLLTQQHLPYNNEHPLNGTALYASTNRHQSIAHSRRDDLISLAYMLLHLARGSLPWQVVRGSTEKRNDTMARVKAQTKVSQLCQGLPQDFSVFVEYVLKLDYDERPKYLYIRKLFHQCLSCIMDGSQSTAYDWELRPQERGYRL